MGSAPALSVLGFEINLVNFDWLTYLLIVPLVLICTTVVSFLFYWKLHFRSQRAMLYFNKTKINTQLLEKCPTLHAYDRVPIWGFNGHIQSIYASQIRKGPTYPLDREQLENRHGGLFAIDWLQCEPTKDAIIVIVPGIAGHTGNDYIKNFIHYCKVAGYRVVSYNWPGCGEHTLNFVEMSTLGDSTDLAVLFKHVRSKYPNTPIYAVGFSLGANLLLRYLGQVKKATPITSAVAMSAGYCGKSGFYSMRQNMFYSKALTKKWKEVILRNADLWKDHPAVDMEKVRKAETLEELDDSLSAKILQYESTEDYYIDHGSIDHLQHIKIPTLLLNSLDDPIVKAHLVDLAKAKVPLNDNLILATTNFGGHMGWVRSQSIWKPDPELWMDKVALEFTAASHSLFSK